MDRLEIVRSSTRTPSTLVSSRLHPTTTETGLSAGTEGLLTTVVGASTARVSLDRVAPPQTLTTRSRRPIWARVQPGHSVETIAAAPEPSGKPQAGAVTADRPPDATLSADRPADPLGDLPADLPREPSGTPRVELTIDSLRNYELVRPIPVVVESLGDRHYVAEVVDLNISTSASSLSDILIILKDQVAQTYDGLRIKKNLDTEQTLQLKKLETYIGKARRGWLDRR